MSGRERKLKNVLARLDEIEKLQSELRRIVPRRTTERVIGEASIERTSSDWSSDPSDATSDSATNLYFEFPARETRAARSVNRGSVGVSVQTEKQGEIGKLHVRDDVRLEADVTKSVFPKPVKTPVKKSAFRESRDTDLEDDEPSDVPIEEIAKPIDASVRTKRKNKVHFSKTSAFDFLDDNRFSEKPEEKSANAIVQTQKFSEPCDAGHHNGDFSSKTTKAIARSVNAYVQTATGQEVAAEPFDILNYFHLPGNQSYLETRWRAEQGAPSWHPTYIRRRPERSIE